MTEYPAATEQLMRKFYQTLSEKEKRRYAAVEAQKLGHGGIQYIAQVLGCAPSTVSSGIRDLASLPEGSGYDPRMRRPGGGRKPYTETQPTLDEAFLEVVQHNTAGDPMQADVLWTNLTQAEIAARLADQHDIHVSETVVRQLLAKHNFTRRKAQKKRR